MEVWAAQFPKMRGRSHSQPLYLASMWTTDCPEITAKFQNEAITVQKRLTLTPWGLG